MPRDAALAQFAAAAVLFDDADILDGVEAIAERVTAVRSMFEKARRPWLIVVDDAAGWDAQLAEVLPQAGPGQIVVTSLNPQWTQPPGVEIRSIRVLSSEEAVDFLCARSGREDRSGARRVARRLGYLALALEQAAAFLREDRHLTLGDYYREIDVDPESMLDVYAPDDHQIAVWRTWRSAIRDCRKRAPASPAVLVTLAYLADHEVPEDVLVDVLRAHQKRTALRKAFANLARFSLVGACSRPAGNARSCW